MKIVTIWESQMQYWGNTKDDPETKLRSGRAFHFYLSKDRANDASPGGPAIERKALERGGLYFMRHTPSTSDVTELPETPVNERDFVNIQVFTSDDPFCNDISSLSWDDDMKRLGRI